MATDREVKEEFLKYVREVKQGESEAILQEQIPPGYRDAVKRYFDLMEESVAGEESAP